MRVLFVQRQPCIRALKYAVGLRSAEPDISLAFAYQGKTLSTFYGAGDELFDEWFDLGPDEFPADALRDAIDRFGPDLIHSHNLPDTLTVLALEVTEGTIPVVHDIHDLQRLRHTPYRDGFPEPTDPLGLERIAVEESSAVVTVSQELIDVVDAAYALPNQTRIVPNFALKRDLVATLPSRPTGTTRPRLVYQGSLAADGGHYDLRGHFGAVIAAGFELHVHPSAYASDYVALAAGEPLLHVHERLDPTALLQTLPRYDLGLATFNSELNAAHMNTVLPNKLFEYLGSGLPVVTLRSHRALARFVEREGVGIVLDDIAELAERVRSSDLASLRESVAALRHRFTFEAVASEVVDLYRGLIGTAPGPEPVDRDAQPTRR